ncbi:MAG: ATP-dependent DNA helicase [Candidatus Goldiibacteriota bacterium]
MKEYFEKKLFEIIEGYEKRDQQILMAEEVNDAFHREQNLIIEAGTGVGKTLAYLIPAAQFAVKHKKRIVIATYSKALQGQIFHKDLPTVKKMIPEMNFDIAYGMSNYICIKRAGEFRNKTNLFEAASETQEIIDFIKNGEGIRENSPFRIPAEIWENINRDKNMCAEERCIHFKECYYWRMRHRLRKAHIIVVNHHLFFSDLVVSKKLLPECYGVVFDEAHRIEEVMRSMFSREFSVFGFYKLLAETEEFLGAKKRGKGPDKEVTSYTRVRKEMEEFIQDVYTDPGIGLAGKKSVLPDENSEIKAYIDAAGCVKDIIYSLRKEIINSEGEEKKKYAEYLMLVIQESAEILRDWLARKDKTSFYWLEERQNKNLSFYITPYKLDELFEENVKYNYSSVVLTSATLSSANSFDYVVKQLGLYDAFSGTLESPFDYKEQSLLYIGRNMPAPFDPAYKEALNEKVEELINASSGGIMILFTSIDMMKSTYKAVKAKFKGKKIPFLIQGSSGPGELIKKFRKKPSALFATNTFWQGIDIKGEELKCVVITKLPFEVPNHPVAKALYKNVRDEGGNDFAEIALPRAIFMLKQGFGRLIRSGSDRGVVAILDSRIATKNYGRRFLESLPDAGKTEEMRDVREFFKYK